MPSSVKKSLDWTLEDGKWMDSFDKLIDDAKPELRKLNLLKKKVRASFNIDSSIENSRNDCQAKKPKKVKIAKNKIISTPVGKLPKQPFKCSISPITLRRQELLVPNQLKTKPKPKPQRNLQSTVLNPSIVVSDYDSLKEKSQAKVSTSNDSLDIILTHPHKVVTIRRRHPCSVYKKDLIEKPKQIINKKHLKDIQKETKISRAKSKQKTKNIVKKGKCNKNLDAALEVIELKDTVDNNNLIEQKALTGECTKINSLFPNSSKVVRADHANHANKDIDVNTLVSKRKTLKDTNAKRQTTLRQSTQDKTLTTTKTNVMVKPKRISNRTKTKELLHIECIQVLPNWKTPTRKSSTDRLNLAENTSTAKKNTDVNRSSNFVDQSTTNATEFNLILSKERESFVNTQRRSKRTICVPESESNQTSVVVTDTFKNSSNNNGKCINGLNPSILQKTLQQVDIQNSKINGDCLLKSMPKDNTENLRSSTNETNNSTNKSDKIKTVLSQDRESFVNTQRRSKRTIGGRESKSTQILELTTDTSKEICNSNEKDSNRQHQSSLEETLLPYLSSFNLQPNLDSIQNSKTNDKFSLENSGNDEKNNSSNKKANEKKSILSQERESLVNTQRRSKRTIGGRDQTTELITNISKENSNANEQSINDLRQSHLEKTLQQVNFGTLNLLSNSQSDEQSLPENLHILNNENLTSFAQYSKPTYPLSKTTSEFNSILNKDRESFINTQRRSKRTIGRRQTEDQQIPLPIDTQTTENVNNSNEENPNILRKSSIEKRQSNSQENPNFTALKRVSNDAKNTTEIIENTFSTENDNSSVRSSNFMEEEVSNHARASQNENIHQEIIRESINHTKSSFVASRKRVKFSEIRQNKKIQLENNITEDPNNDSDIILIEPIEQSKNNERILSTLGNTKSQGSSKSSAKTYEPLKPIKSFKTKPSAKLYDEPLRPIKSFNNRTNPRDLTVNISIQPGKWRKSLNALRRTQLSQVRQSSHRNTCQLEKIIDEDENENESVEYIATTTLIGIRKTIIIKDEDNTFTTQQQQSIIDMTNYKETVLKYCDQTIPLNFENLYSKENMKDCIKIGEGVYGEVFMKKSKNDFIVCKIIPIEGTLMVNGEVQKTFEQILPEIVISKELCRLKEGTRTSDAKHSTAGFVDIKKVSCVEGKYPEHLIKCWEKYDNEKTSENDHPGEFDNKQLFIVLELEFAGKDLESFTFNNAEQSFAALQQIVLTIAVAEEALQFEHRDLHWGNVLVKETNVSEFDYKICGETLTLPTKGIKATIIDYTLSRIKYDNHCFYNDLANDEELFTATGDYQFDIYRMMRNVLGTNWERFEPKTNVFWISYLITKMLIGVQYKETRSKVHSQYLRKMRVLKKEVLEFNSAASFAKYLINVL